MDNTDYDAWAKYIISLLPTDSPKGARIFECGCGTGALTLRLNKAGYDVTGSDISRDMLEVAAEKSRRCGQKTKFICMDMRRIELHRPVDCIIAACDCVNYLTSREDVEKFLLTGSGRAAFCCLMFRQDINCSTFSGKTAIATAERTLHTSGKTAMMRRASLWKCSWSFL